MDSLISISSLHLKVGEKTLLKLPNLEIQEGDVLAIVGESGSGKSLFLKTLMGILPNTINSEGNVLCLSKDWLKLSPEEIREERGKSISMVFQEPMSALNPQMTCGKQLLEAVLVKKVHSKIEAEKLVYNKL